MGHSELICLLRCHITLGESISNIGQGPLRTHNFSYRLILVTVRWLFVGSYATSDDLLKATALAAGQLVIEYIEAAPGSLRE